MKGFIYGAASPSGFCAIGFGVGNLIARDLDGIAYIGEGVGALFVVAMARQKEK